MQSRDGVPQAVHDFVSFDGCVRARGYLQQPDRYRFWRGVIDETPRISRGAGLSYAGASFLADGLSVSHRWFDRVLDFDAGRSVVEVETGITLYALHRFLSARGLYLPVQPGHGRISVGGCIAADVHGKNQTRDGTFINQVEEVTLVHPAHGTLQLSPQRDGELFRLTCGGYGLTGHIVRARLRACAAPIPWVEIRAAPFSSAEQGFNCLREAARNADFSYTWHDMSTAGAGFGEGFLIQGTFVSQDQAPATTPGLSEAPVLSADGRARLPVSLLNRLSTRMLNFFYRWQQRFARNGEVVALADALFPTHKAQAYFQFFGAAGFREYQAILPHAAATNYVDAIHGYLREKPLPITLSSAKFFAGSRDLLRYTGDGISLALNMPAGADADMFMAFLDQRMIELGGIPNIIKDSRLPRAVVDVCYPEADRFREALRAFDSKRLFRSDLSERLKL
ncbi:FAD-binding oxidoreductase [Bradyrhizobium sp. Leo170]|uniref:FAD-binding oxidoreductase n=1 Tax=Bradyrhizobium sp. Leo170 TaxID=1571199 RepID=UPI00102E7764|nr:FAD-binding oxidoreductase [Bradyrhizobium sp. Leo170]TAI65257.1 dehydrogenase [Bradyrhizobium sp. Leo170]